MTYSPLLAAKGLEANYNLESDSRQLNVRVYMHVISLAMIVTAREVVAEQDKG